MTCGKIFYVDPYRIKKGEVKYCSKKCFGVSQIGKTRISKKIKRICLACGKEYYIYPSKMKQCNSKYCSWKCYRTGRGEKIKKVCQSCGKEFYVITSVIKKGGGKYCSRKCCGKGEPKVKKICLTCGKEFYVKPSRIKNGYGKYCSKKCHIIGRTLKIKKTCLSCGKEFYVKQSKIRRGGGKYCSRKCADTEESKLKKVCITCGKEFYVVPSRIINGGGKYCSRKCQLSDYGRHQTQLEKIGYEILDSLNVNYEKQYKIYKYFTDVYIKELNLVIEFDGDYWHGMKKSIKKDAKRDMHMKTRGYTVLRIPEHIVMKKPDKAKTMILKAMNNIMKKNKNKYVNSDIFGQSLTQTIVFS